VVRGATAGEHAVDMGMMLQSLVPGMEHAEETDLGSQCRLDNGSLIRRVACVRIVCPIRGSRSQEPNLVFSQPAISATVGLTADHTSLLHSIDESSLCGLGSVREVCLTERAGLSFIGHFSFLTQPDVPEADFWPGVNFHAISGLKSIFKKKSGIIFVRLQEVLSNGRSRRKEHFH
jgi:hypothetical protein